MNTRDEWSKGSDVALSRRVFGRGALAMSAAGFGWGCGAGDDGAEGWGEEWGANSGFRGVELDVAVQKSKTSQGLIGDPWHCSLSSDLGAFVGVGEQLRVRRNSSEYAVYTVSELRADPPGTVRMSSAGRQRLGTSSTFSAVLDTEVVKSWLSESQAKAQSEWIEEVWGSGQGPGLIALAPHGGSVESGTDQQALALAQMQGGVSWACKGWREGGGAWERWHVTSGELNPASFPMLAVLAPVAFGRAVSFHGMAADGVLVGGGASVAERELVASYLDDALSATGVEVTVAGAWTNLGGSSPANLVNWLCAGQGIQLEQGSEARAEYGELIVEAVAEALDTLGLP